MSSKDEQDSPATEHSRAESPFEQVGEQAGEQLGDGPAAPLEDLEELRRQRDDYLARWQRAAADYKNLRRRTADDIEAAVRRATLPLLSNLLLVIDHLDLALTTRIASEDAQALFTGVKLTRDQFLQVLKQNEVEPVDTRGSFDPAQHEAVAALEAPEREPGTILEAVRRGYTWRGQILRHAHVVVARGPLQAAVEDPDPLDGQ